MHQGVGKSIAWILTGQIGQFVGMQSFGVVADKLGRHFGHVITISFSGDQDFLSIASLQQLE